MKDYDTVNSRTTNKGGPPRRVRSRGDRMVTNNSLPVWVAMPPFKAVPALFCWALTFIVGGCGGPTGPSGPTGLAGPSEPLVQVNSTAEFQTAVLDSKQPVMTLFYKEGCPACAKDEATLGQLAAEYHGRAVFAKYPLANPLGIVKNPDLQEKFDVFVWPTMILFFDGKERKRWLTNDFPIDDYRKSLNEVTTIRRD